MPMLNFLLPPTCLVCGDLSKRPLDLCAACESELPILNNCCAHCAQPLTTDQKICGTCLHHTPLFDRTLALFHYQKPINHLILGLKFNQRLVNAEILGRLLANYLAKQYQHEDKPEIIIPVPLHSKRLSERGYNQALELARPIAKKLNIKIDQYSVMRVKNTMAQSLLPTKERKNNIKKAFVVNKLPNYKHVAVIDDVITTGNTVMELCKLLQQQDVDKIDVWCCARAHLTWVKERVK